MYIPEFIDAGRVLSGSAQQHLDLIPRLLLDAAGVAFVVIILLFIGLNLYGVIYRARPLRGAAYRPRHARPRPLRGTASYDQRRFLGAGPHHLTAGKS